MHEIVTVCNHQKIHDTIVYINIIYTELLYSAHINNIWTYHYQIGFLLKPN